MKKFLSYTGAVLIGLLLGSPIVAMAAAFFVAQGGTGQTTFPAGLISSPGGTTAFTSTSSPTVGYIWATSTTATSTFANGIALTKGCFQMPNGTCLGGGGSGTVTSVGSGTGLSGGPITTSGTLNLLSYIATGSAETNGQLAFWLTSAGTPAKLGSIATSSITINSPLTSGGTPGAVVGGSSWSLSCPSCFTGTAPATSTFAAGTGLKLVTNSSSITYSQLSYLSTSSAETSGYVPFWASSAATPAQLSGGDSGFQWNNTTKTLTFTNGSTTNTSVATSLWIPNSTAPSLTQAGQVAVNTTSASSSLNYSDGTSQGKLFNVTDVGFTYVNVPTAGQGTTTLIRFGGVRGFTITGGSCFSVGGTANIQLGSGTASTTMITSKTSPTAQAFTTIASNNTFQALQPFYIDIGTFSSSGTTTVSCGYGHKNDY